MNGKVLVMTQIDPGRDTRIVEIKGRQVVVRQLKETQMLLLARDSQLVQREHVDGVRRLAAVARMLDILESAIVQPEDLSYITDLQVSGDLEIKDLFSVITAFASEANAPKTAVRRGRPPKTRL